MTAELGPVQRAWCRRLDHGKHVLGCGEWTVAGGWPAGRWLPCWEAASSAVLLGLEMANPLFLSVWGRAALEL